MLITSNSGIYLTLPHIAMNESYKDLLVNFSYSKVNLYKN